MNYSGINRFTIIWLALVIIMVTWLASGCRSMKTDIQKTSRQVDSATVHRANAGQINRSDSTAFTREATSQTTERTSAAGQQLQVTFQDSGSTSPVILQPRGDGSFILRPGGRRIVGLSYSGTQAQARKDRTGTTSVGATRKNTFDSSYRNLSDSNHLQVEEKSKVKDKQTSSTPRWLWTVLVVMGAAVTLLYILFKRK